ncbi:HAD family hydrolase [Coraliomargarita sinensis]|uniref:sucrose-phosphate synthase n=1 Tax=Coraliomargarita sinensis TaxID=2174842 RepID=A0A317ZQ38_9BACT|nr:HAD-IIB family hydrolase [Coraliomargarita sinensis]PXA05531.1 HAD family hydrolase [Coraliomargarita sinensis]
MAKDNGIRIALISLHGLIRGKNLELGRDEDTGGQTRYVLELAKALGERDDIHQVDLITRQVVDERVSEDYAVLEEALSDKVSIIRIPFGPKRYLSKTKLWPYMEVFVDQCLNHFRRTDTVPDVIHGHYADAGYGGGQLARLLGVPFVFTGHSLGRIKRERLIESGVSEDKIESNYNISARIEGEEFALESCSLICTSTHQEVREQYEHYEHYVPERMEVIPPGVDLSSFHTPRKGDKETDLEVSIKSFLHEPEKPMIAAMARPDERKNLEMLVRAYGESPRLQREANLVLIMGSRDDLRDMPPGQRNVLQNVLTLIDVYDLYGKVAYPKRHKSEDVPALYRAVTRSRGVFINAAMTEPFGLTLLEAAASGAPIVATNDGGPSDIIANCKNGMLVDPFDPKAIEKALLHTLIEPGQWEEWSEAGVENVHKHYSWERHCDRYMRDVEEILKQSEPPVGLPSKRTPRRLKNIDRLIIADIDNTLTGNDDAMHEFFQLITDAEDNIGFGIATGRRFDDVMQLMKDYGMPQPEVLICAVGTEIYYGKNFTLDRRWQKHIDFRWEPDRVHEVLDLIEGLYPQEEHEQSEYKISYRADFSVAPKLPAIKRHLREAGLRVKVIVSLGMFLDIIPSRAGSGLSIRQMAYKWGFPLENILVAGDSGNDEGMLAGNTLGVVVGNYSEELEKLRRYPRVYFAEAGHAAGIIEGVRYYNFLDKITIPNDKPPATDA